MQIISNIWLNSFSLFFSFLFLKMHQHPEIEMEQLWPWGNDFRWVTQSESGEDIWMTETKWCLTANQLGSGFNCHLCQHGNRIGRAVCECVWKRKDEREKDEIQDKRWMQFSWTLAFPRSITGNKCHVLTCALVSVLWTCVLLCPTGLSPAPFFTNHKGDSLFMIEHEEEGGL